MENETKIFYICDKKQCKNCYEKCHYTSDINHAINFENIGGYIRETNKHQQHQEQIINLLNEILKAVKRNEITRVTKQIRHKEVRGKRKGW